jgi:glucose-1-phosphate thymidylyltransferase
VPKWQNFFFGKTMRTTKGIILAAGKSTRLYPATLGFGKQLLPIFDKPMIYYPISLLMQAGIHDILIITAPRDLNLFKALLGDGSQYGIHLSFLPQTVARGIADAFLIGEEFIGKDDVCLMLGDNFFYGSDLENALRSAQEQETGATIFCYSVAEPSAYGVAVLDQNNSVTRLVEKPQTFISPWAVTGLYFYDNQACTLARTLQPSARNEYEITDLNTRYLEQNSLQAVCLGTGITWSDMGTHNSVLDTSIFVRDEQQRHHLKIGSLNETAYKAGFIDKQQMLKNAQNLNSKDYADVRARYGT